MPAPGELDPFADTFIAMAAARAVMTATRIGIFDALAETPADPAGLAERLGLDPVGVEALLTALASLGYLEAAPDGTHRPTPGAARALGVHGAETIAHFIGDYNAHAWEMLGRLDDLLQGRAQPPRHQHPPGHAFWEPYIRGLWELSRAEHDANAALVPVDEPARLVDLAGGHGAFAMAMCRRHPRLRATVLDLPASAEVGRRIVSEEGFADRIAFREGDALEADLGAGLDVCSAFNLLHHLPPDAVRHLLARARQALAPAGWLVVGDSERTEPGEPVTLHGALSAVVYYASSGTRNYTQREVTGWLGEAGFSDVRVHRSRTSPWRLLYLAG